jgi:hypothetical protein
VVSGREDGVSAEASIRYYVATSNVVLPKSQVLITSASVRHAGVHDHVAIWNRGGLAGSLCVCEGDGAAIVAALGLIESEPQTEREQDRPTSLERMLDIAHKLLDLGKFALGRHVGFTIVVHTRRLQPGAIKCALATTLPNRTMVRVLFAELLARSAMADGVDAEDVSELVAGDLAAFDAREKSS